jgi:hypothetical protein
VVFLAIGDLSEKYRRIHQLEDALVKRQSMELAVSAAPVSANANGGETARGADPDPLPVVSETLVTARIVGLPREVYRHSQEGGRCKSGSREIG